MSVLDITTIEPEISEIKWCDCDSYNLVKEGNEVTICELGVAAMDEDDVNLLSSAVEAEQLIKAIQKAIDLGWFK